MSVSWVRPGGASTRMNHSWPKKAPNMSGCMARKNDASEIWLAWAAIALRLRSRTSRTSTVVVISSRPTPRSSSPGSKSSGISTPAAARSAIDCAKKSLSTVFR